MCENPINMISRAFNVWRKTKYKHVQSSSRVVMYKMKLMFYATTLKDTTRIVTQRLVPRGALIKLDVWGTVGCFGRGREAACDPYSQ